MREGYESSVAWLAQIPPEATDRELIVTLLLVLAVIGAAIAVAVAMNRARDKVQGWIKEANVEVSLELKEVILELQGMRGDLKTVLLRAERHDGKVELLENQMRDVRGKVEGLLDRTARVEVSIESRMASFERRIEDMRR